MTLCPRNFLKRSGGGGKSAQTVTYKIRIARGYLMRLARTTRRATECLDVHVVGASSGAVGGGQGPPRYLAREKQQ